MSGKIVEPFHEKILIVLENYLIARISKDTPQMMGSLSDYLEVINSMPIWKPDVKKIQLETWVNEANLF